MPVRLPAKVEGSDVKSGPICSSWNRILQEHLSRIVAVRVPQETDSETSTSRQEVQQLWEKRRGKAEQVCRGKADLQGMHSKGHSPPHGELCTWQRLSEWPG